MNRADKRFVPRGCTVPGNYYASCGEGCSCQESESKQLDCACRQMPSTRTCDQKGCFDDSFALAMAYVPLQEWKGISDTGVGLQNGTVFGELVKPFCRAGRGKF